MGQKGTRDPNPKSVSIFKQHGKNNCLKQLFIENPILCLTSIQMVSASGNQRPQHIHADFGRHLGRCMTFTSIGQSDQNLDDGSAPKR